MRWLVALPLQLRSVYSRISTVNHRFLLLCGESVQICVSIGLRIAAPGSRFKLVTTPTETCPICGGTGWQTIERGKEREAVRCECRVRDRGGGPVGPPATPPPPPTWRTSFTPRAHKKQHPPPTPLTSPNRRQQERRGVTTRRSPAPPPRPARRETLGD